MKTNNNNLVSKTVATLVVAGLLMSSSVAFAKGGHGGGHGGGHASHGSSHKSSGMKSQAKTHPVSHKTTSKQTGSKKTGQIKPASTKKTGTTKTTTGKKTGTTKPSKQKKTGKQTTQNKHRHHGFGGWAGYGLGLYAGFGGYGGYGDDGLAYGYSSYGDADVIVQDTCPVLVDSASFDDASDDIGCVRDIAGICR